MLEERIESDESKNIIKLENITNNEKEENDSGMDENEIVIARFERLISVFSYKVNNLKSTLRKVHPELKAEYDTALQYLIDLKEISKQEGYSLTDTSIKTMTENLKIVGMPSAHTIVKGTYFNLFSELDYYIESMLIDIFESKPDLIKASEKQFSVKEIFESGSLDDIKKAIIDKEIETIKRESYVEQINIFEKLFSINTLKKYKNWSNFVECTQRRNIIMHCNGRVNKQYYEICKKYNCNIKDIVLGDSLRVNYKYLIESMEIIEETAIKLCIIIWNKLFKTTDNSSFFYRTISSYVYGLLEKEEWKLAEEMASFAMTIMIDASTTDKLVVLVNHCIALREQNKTTELVSKLQQWDFSATNNEFLLAKAVLLENSEDIIRYMKSVGDSSSTFTRQSYTLFPLFKSVRHLEYFKETFELIFKDNLDTSILTDLINESEDIRKKTDCDIE